MNLFRLSGILTNGKMTGMCLNTSLLCFYSLCLSCFLVGKVYVLGYAPTTLAEHREQNSDALVPCK